MKRLALLLLLGCSPRDFTSSELAILRTLTDMPEPPVDRSNQWVRSDAAAQLGKLFFFDDGFSGPPAMVDVADRPGAPARTEPFSCASCHDPASGGADRTSMPNEVSIGAGAFNVNAPSVVNAAYWDLWFWNGRTDSLWSVSLIASEAKVAFNTDRMAVMWRIWSDYRDGYEAIFGPLPVTDPALDAVNFPLHGKPGKNPDECTPGSGEPFDDAFDCMLQSNRDAATRVFVNFGKAIAAYETKLVVTTSAFDAHLAGGEPMAEEAIRGAKLFVGKAACIECHNTPLFSDRSFHNTGVPETAFAKPTEAECVAGSACDCISGMKCIPWGAYDGYTRLPNWSWLRTRSWSDDTGDTSRAQHYTRELTDELKGAWRTPSLRGLLSTAPYMHNGAYRTLEEVVWHYDRAGTSAGSASEFKAPELQTLDLTPREVGDLVAFLEALNGDPLPVELTKKP